MIAVGFLDMVARALTSSFRIGWSIATALLVWMLSALIYLVVTS